MTVRVIVDEATDQYTLGDDVTGVFVPFVSLDGAYVRARVEAGELAKEAADAEQKANKANKQTARSAGKS